MELGFHGVSGAVALRGGLSLWSAVAGWCTIAGGVGWDAHVEGDGSSGGGVGVWAGSRGGMLVQCFWVGVVGWCLAGEVRFKAEAQRDEEAETYLGSVRGRDRVDRGSLGVTCVTRQWLGIVGQGCDGAGGHVDDVIKARLILK